MCWGVRCRDLETDIKLYLDDQKNKWLTSTKDDRILSGFDARN